ncbi:MAG TPA: SpoIIE family protein phosphatase [Solirubrobacteraceae bacterium]|nr:SpoIIE family protein phosphatase [Solirubrobacteraceae bacterium]
MIEVERSAAVAGDGWYEPLLDLLPSPLLLISPVTGRVFFANRAAHETAGGAFPMDLQTPEHRRVAAGERFTNVRVDWDTPAGTRSLIASGETIVPPASPPVAVLTFEDVTELEAAHRRAGALADAGAMLAGSLDFDATLQLIARLAVPRLADWCFVELLRDDGTIDRVAIEASDPALLEHAREYDRRYPLDPDAPVGSPQVIRSGEPDLQVEISDAMLELVAHDAEHLEILRALGFRSSMIVPLRAGGRVIGDLALVSAASGRRYGPADLVTAQELADRCGLFLENARLYQELERAHDELEAILGGLADAVTVQGPDGRLGYVNDAAVRLLGEPLGLTDRSALIAAPPEQLAAGFEILGEDGTPFPLERLPGRLALAGEEPEPVTLRYRVRATGEIRWSRVKARPMRAPDGRVTQAINVIEDITDLKQAEETQRILAEAGRVLAGSLDYEETLRRVAWLAVPALADWCTVDVVGDRGLERVAVAHADPAHAELAERLRGVVIDPRGTVGPAAVLRTGRSQLHRHVDEAHYRAAALNPTHRSAMLEIGARSNATVPMAVRGQRLGVMTLSTAGSGRILGPEEVAVLEELGRRAALAVDSARLYRQRSTIARTLQNSLLPPLLPEIPGIDAAALYLAAGAAFDVGGDFYDLFSVAEYEWIAVIGDVCGKGAEAAAVTALARYTIRTAAARRRSPAAILSWLNDDMCRADLAGRFCTVACVHLDISRPAIRARIACGGHPPALLRRAGGAVEDLGVPGTLLGLVRDPHLEDARAELHAGDALVLFTDGITEARAPKRVLDPEDLHDALRAMAPDSSQRIVEQLTALALGNESAPPRDDIAVLALRARG